MLYADLKTHIWILFLYVWMTLASINARGLLQEMQWEKLTYPNPLTQPFECNRQDKSYICDPEGVLTSADADRLDFLANEIHQSTPCLCSSCATKDANGISLGIFLRSNLTHYERSIKGFSTAEMTRYIRKQWRLGLCDDDIVILVILEEKKSHFDMGDPVEEVMSREVADKIFSDCVIHFETGYYSQGLRSIVNSLYDNLRRSQKRKGKNENVSIGVIVGWSLGIASLILVIVLIICRQRVRRARAKSLKTAGSWNETKTRKGIEYGVCETNDGESENEKNSNGSDAEDPLEENTEDREMCVEKKLHLSQQYTIDSQEKEIICTNTETTNNFSANFRKIGSMEISEL